MNCKAASALLLLLASPAAAIPVIPNFSQGVVSTHTETKTVSGSGVEPSSGTVTPSLRGTGLDLANRSSWVQSTPGAAFQFAETYQGPGLIEKVTIDRETIIESVTDSTSTFSQ